MPLEEPLKWIQDKAPHKTGMLKAVVLQGAPESNTAGIPIEPLTADSWTVHAPLDSILVDQVKEGDTLERGIWKNITLTVQRSMVTESGYWILCTATQRAPAD